MGLLQFFWRLFMRIKNPSCTIKALALGKELSLGKKVTLDAGSVIAAGSIGDYTFINKYCLVDKNVKSIGKFCSIAYNVRIGLGGHPTDWVSTHPFAYQKKYGIVELDINFEEGKDQSTTVGNDVWIGTNATILAGVKVGDGAIIGAHSLVTEDVEPYSVVVGTPAKHLRYRFDEKVRKELLASEWWNWPIEKIRSQVKTMGEPEKFLSGLK